MTLNSQETLVQGLGKNLVFVQPWPSQHRSRRGIYVEYMKADLPFPTPMQTNFFPPYLCSGSTLSWSRLLTFCPTADRTLSLVDNALKEHPYWEKEFMGGMPDFHFD